MQVSLSVLETTEMVNDAIKVHNLDDTAAETLGGLLTACAYMAGCLKSEKGAVSITVKSGDGSATASVSGDSEGHIRGYIEGGEYGLKGGYMTVVKDDHISEQIPTAVAIGVKVKNGKCVTAGGVVMQLLPGTTEYNMDKAEETMQNFVKITDELEKFGAEGILREYFGGETKEKSVYETFPEYKCNCSRKKIERVIKSVSLADLLKIIEEDGEVSVHCHYCNTDYKFGEKDVRELFANDG